MQASELRGLSADELNKKCDEIKTEMLNKRFQRATSQVEDTSDFRKMRRSIAKIKTVLTELKSSAN